LGSIPRVGGVLNMPGGVKLIDSTLVIVLNNGEQEIERELAPPADALRVVLGSAGCKLPRLPMTHASELDILHHFDDRLPAESPKHLFETLPDRSDQGPRAPAGYGFDSLEPS
jgi:hypothetical protein